MSVLPFGSWPSPITSRLLVADAVSLEDAAVGAVDVWWAERRPQEGGRVQIVRHRPGGDRVDVLPEGFAARTRVHEYGGGSWWLHGADVVFANWSDQRLWRLDAGADDPFVLTPDPTVEHGDRYADGRFTADGRWVVCVRERHADGEGEPANEIVAVWSRPRGDVEEPVVLVTGSDFVAAPRVSPDGRWITWFQWNHPDMPWDGTELHVAELHSDPGGSRAISIGPSVVVAGGRDESVTQPEWTADGDLLFLSDRTDWWNLYRLAADRIEAALAAGPGGSAPEAVAVAPLEAEIGVPHWVFDQSRYAVLADGRILVAIVRDGIDQLGVVPVAGAEVVPLRSPFTSLAALRPFGSGAVLIGASPTSEAVVAVVDVPAELDPDGTTEVALAVLRPARDLGIDPGWISTPEPISFATTGDRFAHALFYPPTGVGVAGPDDEAPPLLVLSHGGPTSAARPQLNLAVQFWTSRGFGVVDVNYGGSTGYGRRYRRRLIGEWGIVDVDDCVAATRLLVDRGDADRDRLIVRGGSAGGFTTLAALAFREVFAAGCSLYGIGDLEALARDTHKFEARYLDSLVGPYPARRDLYVERSPIHNLDELDCPVILLQGAEDAVVPPSQAELVVAALEDNGQPYAYLLFEGEQHGFRKAETIVRAIEAEAYFYSRIFDFELADEVEPVEIANL
ncbi:MAG TPA: prolyl oligopeptidase family serine peptidase [Acidimicrobiales bacterium]